MDHIDLTISTGYVPGWRFWEGARELIQNAFDRERETDDGQDPVKRVMSEYRAGISYDEDSETMIVESAGTTIPRNTLLLGQGSKSAGGNTIGQHGEGYKLAMLALTRCGRNIVVDNGPERWTPEIVESEFLGVKVLRIRFEEGDADNTSLRFTISNVQPTDWAAVVCNIRRLHEPGEEMDGEGGTVLIGDSEMGRLYVGGLFVSVLHERFLYGYDFDPAMLHLDRDRTTVDSFDLAWECGRVLRSVGIGGERLVLKAMQETTADIAHFLKGSSPLIDKVRETAFEEFQAKHGEVGFPVVEQWEVDHVRLNYPGVKPVIVGKVLHDCIMQSDAWRAHVSGLTKTERPTPEIVLRTFFDEHREYFPQTLADAFATEIIDRAEVEGWTL